MFNLPFHDHSWVDGERGLACMIRLSMMKTSPNFVIKLWWKTLFCTSPWVYQVEDFWPSVWTGSFDDEKECRKRAWPSQGLVLKIFYPWLPTKLEACYPCQPLMVDLVSFQHFDLLSVEFERQWSVYEQPLDMTWDSAIKTLVSEDHTLSFQRKPLQKYSKT